MIVKPTLEYGFDYRILTWDEPAHMVVDNAQEQATSQRTS